MSDRHLRILRVAAHKRARQLRDTPSADGDAEVTPPEVEATPAGVEAHRRRRLEIQRLAVRARMQLADASARRRRHGR
jgi:hypothetical protein